MKFATTSRSGLFVLSVLSCAVSHAQEGDSNRAQERVENTGTLAETIIVSASRRAESLGNAEAAVTLVDGIRIQEQSIFTIAELDKVLPGMVTRTRGNRAYSSFTVRGVSSPDFYNPSVQIYVDNVPQEAAFYAQDLLDVERVEFLRGPQGTLYGRNAFGGVLNIFTRKPREQTFSVNGDVATRNWRGGARGTLPLGQNTFLDLAAGTATYEGRVDDISTGRNNVDESEMVNGRFALRYEPENGPLNLMLTYSGEELESREELYLFDAEMENFRYFSATQGPLPLLDRSARSGSLQWNYDVGIGTVSGISSYQHVDMVRNISGLSFPEDVKTFSQVLQYASAPGAFSYVAGLAWFDQEFSRIAQGYPGYYGNAVNALSMRDISVFGEMEYRFDNGLSLTLGGRLNRDEAEVDFSRQPPADFAFVNDEDFTNFQPKLALGYALSERTNVYALASHGYKVGGFNHSVASPADANPYASEKAWNYEVGGRGLFADGSLSLGAALYYISSENKQLYVGPVGLQVIRNAGDAVSRGLEFELVYQPNERLAINGTLTLGQSRFESVVDPVTNIVYDDNHVPFAPDSTANLNLRYLLFTSLLGGSVSVQASAHHTGKMYFDEANTLAESDVTTFDAALEYGNASGTTVRLYVKNAADEIYRTASFNYYTLSNADYRSNINQGRVIGISLGQEF